MQPTKELFGDRGFATNDRDREIIENHQRGCNYLKRDNTYFRADIGPGGTIPPFVRFTPPIKYIESSFRSYKEFPGTSWELSINDRITHEPQDAFTNHLDRLEGAELGDHWGIQDTAEADGILMYIGKTHYPWPDDFIDEVRQAGLSKAFSSRGSVPTVIPALTRLFLIHPNAIQKEDADPDSENFDDYYPGIIGWVPLTRIVHTEDEGGDVPGYIQEYADQDLLDIVDFGEEIPEDDPRHFENQDADYWDRDLETGSSRGLGMDEYNERQALIATDDTTALTTEDGAMYYVYAEGDGKAHIATSDGDEWGDALCNRFEIPPEASLLGPLSQDAPSILDDNDDIALCGNCSTLLHDVSGEGSECEFCGREFDTDRARRGHQRACPEKEPTGDTQ